MTSSLSHLPPFITPFPQNANLYVAPTNGQGVPKQLTFDGSDDVLNGIFDWVYEGSRF